MTEKQYGTILEVLADKVATLEQELGYFKWRCKDLEATLNRVEETNKKEGEKE